LILWIPLIFLFFSPIVFFIDRRAHCVVRSGGGTAFRDAAAFNANISKWETGKVTTMDYSTSTSAPHLFMDGISNDMLWIDTLFLLFFFSNCFFIDHRAHCVVRSGGGSV
jgi:surface protein